MSSIASPDSSSHDAGPTTFFSGSARDVRQLSFSDQGSSGHPRNISLANLPYDDDTPMPTSFITRRKLTVESTPEANPALVVITQDEPLGPYRARLENLASRRQSYRTRARKEHDDAGQAAVQQVRQQQQYRRDRPPNCRPTRTYLTKKTL